MTTTKAADAMTILRRLIFAECDRRRPRVLPAIVILLSLDDQCRVRRLHRDNRPDDQSPDRPSFDEAIAVARAATAPARLCTFPSRTSTEGILNLGAMRPSA